MNGRDDMSSPGLTRKMFNVSFLVLVLIGLSQCTLATKTYKGYKTYSVIPWNQAHLRLLQGLELGAVEADEIDFWTEAHAVGETVDVMLGPSSRPQILDMFRQANIEYYTKIPDVGRLIEQQMRKNHSQTSVNTQGFELDWGRYHTLYEIYSWLELIAAQCGTDCEVLSIGKSYEGIPLKVIKISRPGTKRRAVWLDSTIHAREWVAPAVSSYIISRLINDYGTGKDPEIDMMRESFDWYIEPIVNPDGYEFTWEKERLWRKTRSPNKDSKCVGTDANRNFDFQWTAPGGASGDPCSLLYRGDSPASEVEIKAIQDFITPRRAQFDIAFTLHSYTQVLIIPWGYTKDDVVENFEELEEVAFKVRDSIVAVHNVSYEARQPNGLLSGNTMDWMRGKADVRFSYLLELRDTGEHGFLLPPEQILPNAQEVLGGVKTLISEVKNRTRG